MCARVGRGGGSPFDTVGRVLVHPIRHGKLIHVHRGLHLHAVQVVEPVHQRGVLSKLLAESVAAVTCPSEVQNKRVAIVFFVTEGGSKSGGAEVVLVVSAYCVVCKATALGKTNSREETV